MKKYILILVGLLITALSINSKPLELPPSLSYNEYLDSSYFIVTVIDSLGNRDSVMMMIHSDATLDVDSAFGEVNLFGQPYNDPEIRIIQRQKGNLQPFLGIHPDSLFPNEISDSLIWILDTNSYQGYFKFFYTNSNLELKKDVRPFYQYFYPYPLMNYPVLFINASNYPIEVEIKIFGDMQNEFNVCSAFNLTHDRFNGDEDDYKLNSSASYSYSFIIMEKPLDTLRIGFRYEPYLSVQDIHPISLKLFDLLNPIDDELYIENEQLEEIIIFDLLGNKVLSFTPKETTSSIDVSHLQRGAYIVKAGNRTGKFIKR